VATDNFNRGDSADLGADWSVPTGGSAWAINTNRARPGSITTFCMEYYGTGTFADNQYAQAVVVARESNAGTGPGVAVRMATGAVTYYGARANAADGVFLFKSVAGVESPLAVGGACVNGDTLRIEANGTTIRALVNDIEQVSTTDSDIASGRPGITGFSATLNVELDDWEGADLAAGLPAGVLAALGSEDW